MKLPDQEDRARHNILLSGSRFEVQETEERTPVTEKLWIDYLFLSAVLIISAVNIYYITISDQEPPKWDEAVHLKDSFVYYNIISDPSQLSISVIKEIINKSENYPLIRPSGYYPPLVPIVTSLLYLMFGMSENTAVMSNAVFLLVLVFSVYGIGRILIDRTVGLFASLILLLSPIILQHSVIYYLDLPLTAMSALAVYTLLKTEYFTNTRYSFIAGICFGSGMLTKWTFLFFIAGPLTYLICKSYRLNKEEEKSAVFYSKKSIKNIILYLFAGIITFGPYYFPILSQLITETFKYTSGALSHSDFHVFSFGSAAYYLAALWSEMITPPGFILFIAGMIVLTLSRKQYKIFLLIWTGIPYLITFLIQNKTPRYMMPWLVPVSLIIAFFIFEAAKYRIPVSRKNLRNYAAVLTLLLSGIFFLREEIKLRESVIENSKSDWNIPDIISVVEKDISRNKQHSSPPDNLVYLATIPDHHYINGQTIRYYAALKKLPVNVIKLQDYSDTAFNKFVQNFYKYDYILTKSASNIVLASFQESVTKMNEYLNSQMHQFDCIKTFREPDGSEVSIYKRKY